MGSSWRMMTRSMKRSEEKMLGSLWLLDVGHMTLD